MCCLRCPKPRLNSAHFFTRNSPCLVYSCIGLGQVGDYEAFLSDGKWLGKDPLVSATTLNRATAVGMVLGTVVEGATFAAGIGMPIANYLAVAGAATGGIGLGGYSAYKSATDSGKTPMTQRIATPVAMTVLGAFSGVMYGAAWGPFIGAEAASNATEAFTDKVWNWNHRSEYKNMYSAMRGL